MIVANVSLHNIILGGIEFQNWWVQNTLIYLEVSLSSASTIYISLDSRQIYSNRLCNKPAEKKYLVTVHVLYRNRSTVLPKLLKSPDFNTFVHLGKQLASKVFRQQTDKHSYKKSERKKHCRSSRVSTWSRKSSFKGT